MLSLVSVLPDQTTADRAHCSWWMVYFKGFILSSVYWISVYWIILVCVLSDRSIEGKPQRTFLLNSLDNIIIQASYILVGVILYGQQK